MKKKQGGMEQGCLCLSVSTLAHAVLIHTQEASHPVSLRYKVGVTLFREDLDKATFTSSACHICTSTLVQHRLVIISKPAEETHMSNTANDIRLRAISKTPARADFSFFRSIQPRPISVTAHHHGASENSAPV